MSGMRATCFIMGTGVLVEDPEKPGLFSKKVIEDVHDGDKVWTRNENDPDGPLELKAVTKTFRYTAYDLQTVSVEDQTGNVEVIHVTDAHPFYVEGLGWTGAAELEAGEHLVSDDGEVLTVTANVDEPHPEGIPVFNFEVEGDHTYFVSDGVGDAVSDEDWVWVHNWCDGLHHMFSRALGNRLPYGDRALTYLSRAEHGALHGALNAHLERYTTSI
jgi:hypothetical protein